MKYIFTISIYIYRFGTYWAAPVAFGCSLVQACPVFVTVSVTLCVY